MFNKIFRKVASGHLGSVADASKIILTVGPGGSYFTPSKDNPIWRDIPTALDAKINASEIEPRQVALGRNNAWVCLWADHTISYSLGTEYSDLADRLQRYMQTNDRVAFVALDPYDNDSWFLVDCDGLISWAFRNMKYNEISGIQEMAGDYMQRRARKTGATFSYTNTSGAGTKRVDITPQTVHDKHDSGSSKILPGPLSDQWLAMRRRLPPVQWRRNNVIASSAAAVSTATACGLMGMKMRPALAVGGIAGVVTLALTSTDLIA